MGTYELVFALLNMGLGRNWFGLEWIWEASSSMKVEGISHKAWHHHPVQCTLRPWRKRGGRTWDENNHQRCVLYSG